MSTIGQYWLIMLENGYISWALVQSVNLWYWVMQIELVELDWPERMNLMCVILRQENLSLSSLTICYNSASQAGLQKINLAKVSIAANENRNTLLRSVLLKWWQSWQRGKNQLLAGLFRMETPPPQSFQLTTCRSSSAGSLRLSALFSFLPPSLWLLASFSFCSKYSRKDGLAGCIVSSLPARHSQHFLCDGDHIGATTINS